MVLQLAPEEPEAGPWRAELLSAVAGAVARRVPGRGRAGRPAVLAVDGRSNNGKTTVAARIRDMVPGAVVIHTDIGWVRSRFGWDDLLTDGILLPVYQGRAVRCRRPRWDEHGRDGSIEVPAGYDGRSSSNSYVCGKGGSGAGLAGSLVICNSPS